MSATARVGGFVLGLAAVGAAATGIGVAVGPVETSSVQHDPGHDDQEVPPHDGPAAGPSPDPVAPILPAGLGSSQDGYSLEVLDDRREAPGSSELRFRVTDASGATVTAYEESHGKDMHLIIVRRDLTGYRHLHPRLDASGTWSVPVMLPSAGEYRVLADFHPTGSANGYTLGHDLSVAGYYQPRALPAPARTATVDGYEVRLAGTLRPGTSSRLTLSISRGGVPVTDLEPYLGSYGHLVALRDGDLAYLHVHPEGTPGDGRTSPGPGVTFSAEVPSPGRYRLFLDFQHEGRVRTAAFSMAARPALRARTTTPGRPAEPDEPRGSGEAEHDAHDH